MNDIWKYRDEVWSESGDVVGFDVQAVDGSIGAVDEATTETDRDHIVVDTGFWIFGTKRLIPAGAVTKVDHDTRSIAVSLSRDQVEAAPDYDPDSDDEARDRHGEYYGRYAG